jgi:hypothetical protein
MKYIYHHLGLGDHIICNGIVRHLIEELGQVGVFCKEHYLENVKYMYKDDENIKILPFLDDSSVNSFITTQGIENETIRIGFDKLYHYDVETFDESFYRCVNLPFDYRFEKFKFERNTEKEQEILNLLNPTGEPYIYLHDDPSRGYPIDETRVRKDIKIIRNDKRFLMFDMLGIIENAEEVHIMQTGMKDLINSYVFEKPKFFLHWYVRNYEKFLDTKGINKFEKIY